MANEFVTKKFLDAAGVKILWDEVAAEIKVEADRAKAAEAALDSKVTTLSGVVDGVSAKANQNATDIDVLEGKVDALEKGTYDDTEVRNLIGENTAAIEAEVERATAAEAQVLTDAKAYADEVKTSILGEDLTETYDTLKEIADWIEGAGVDATELTEAIAAEAKLRSEADEDFETRVAALESVDVATKAYADQAEADAIATAATDATTKANKALDDAKVYADGLNTAMDARVTALEGVDVATKADVATAKSEAIAAAAADATSKADQAELDAIAAAATDATNKANTAEANAKAYADGLAGNYDAAGSAAAAEAAAKSYADTETKKAYDAIDALTAAEIRTAIGKTTE